jgi:hypothetical protein
MLNIYEKAREFKEKYRVDISPHGSSENSSDPSLSYLYQQLEDYSRVISKLRSEILVLENEISLVQEEVDEFLLLYYEKFSEILLSKGSFSSTENYITSNLEFDSEDNLLMLEKRSEAFDMQLKQTYRKLAKLCHPDSAGAEFPAVYFNHIQELYKNRDLNELLYIESKIQDKIHLSESSVVRKIEKLEVQQNSLKAKYENLISEKDKILNSPEYKLFLKYKLSEIRGYDFFDSLLKNVSI